MCISDDEYDIEIDKITAIINEDSSVGEIAEAISHVFSLMFTPESNTPDDCLWPARLIREEFDMKHCGVVDKSGRQKVSNDKVRRYKTTEVYMAAVQHSFYILQFVPEASRTEELCLAGAKHVIRRIDVENHLGEDTSGFVDEYLKHVPENLKEKIGKAFREL